MSTVRELEKQLYLLKLEVDKARRQNPPEEVPDFTFETSTGQTTLSELFQDKGELILIHNMGTSCDYCTMWADILQTSLPFLKDHAAVALVSPDSTSHQAETAKARSWGFSMVHDPGYVFTRAMGFCMDEGDQTHVAPGCSTFKKRPDGQIVRTNYTQFGPLDDFNPVWHFWSMLDREDSWHPDPSLFISKP